MGYPNDPQRIFSYFIEYYSIIETAILWGIPNFGTNPHSETWRNVGKRQHAFGEAS
jgi:hypothetical protein